MNLLNKRLLLLGGSAFAKDIKEYAIKKGIYLISVGNSESALYKKIADEAYLIDFKNYEEVCKLIKDKKIEGFFGGASEVSIDAAITLSELSGVPFYTNRKQWDELSNKEIFKNQLRKFDIGIIPEYDVDDFLTNKEYTKSLYPVLVKPVDGSGAKGISICYNYKQFYDNYHIALESSVTKRAIVEKYLVDLDDVFIRYHIQDFSYSISSSFDKYTTSPNGSILKYPIAYLHPSKHLKNYLNNVDLKMQELFKSLKIKNGVITLQAFVDQDSNFYFYEAGYRLGGSQSYIFTDRINQSNSLHYMINLALSNRMSDENIKMKDNPFFKQSCCNLYFPVKSGKIKKVIGLKELYEIPEILNITEFYKEGDFVKESNSLDQVCFRMHLMAENPFILSSIISKINTTLKVINEDGENMVMEYFNNYNNVLNERNA